MLYRGSVPWDNFHTRRCVQQVHPHRQTSGLLQPHHRQGCRKEQPMFKRMLVPLDGSEHAERAIPVAARIARVSGGTIIFVRVLPPADLSGYAATKDPMF